MSMSTEATQRDATSISPKKAVGKSRANKLCKVESTIFYELIAFGYRARVVVRISITKGEDENESENIL